MTKPKSSRKKKAQASNTQVHGKLSLLRQKLKLRQPHHKQVEQEGAGNRSNNVVAPRVRTHTFSVQLFALVFPS